MRGLIQAKAEDLSRRNLQTNIYGIARSVLALGTLITFLFNDSSLLFSIVPGHYKIFGDTIFSHLNFFYLLSKHPALAKVISIVILLVVISSMAETR